MTRRVLSALAALAVFFAASLVWTQPAVAGPNTGMCSLEEWRNPASFADCAKRTRESIGQTTGCVTAPTPGSPTSGMPGWFTSRPESSLRDGVGGQYSMYGVGGYGLDTYDMGCLGSVKHPDLVAWNTIASSQFNTAAAIMGAANGLRDLAYDPGTMWGWSDKFVEVATNSVYQYIFTPFGGVMLAVVGVFLLWRARHGDMSEAMKITAWALFVMVAVTGVAKWPVAAANGADAVATKGLAVVHRVLGPAPQDIPENECVLGGEACKDRRSVSTRSADVAVDAVLYRTWLRAMIGTADSATAKKYGPALFDATSLTWGEADRAEQSPQLRKQLMDQKAATFNAVAEQIRNEDPLAYEHLQGIHGSDRAGAGTVALLSAAAFAAFDMSASTVILFAFLIFRIAIIALPLLGTVGLFQPASRGLRRVFHMSTAAAANIVVFGAGAGLYLTFVDLIFRSSLPGAGQMAAVALVGVACFMLLHPLRHLLHTATGRSRAEDGLITRAFKAGKTIHADRKADQAVVGEAGPVGDATARPRPEAGQTSPRNRMVRTVAAAVAPTVTAAADSPYAAAVTSWVTGATHRPETTAAAPRPSKVKTAAATAATVAATVAGGPAGGAAASATVGATTRPRPRPRPRPHPENRS